MARKARARARSVGLILTGLMLGAVRSRRAFANQTPAHTKKEIKALNKKLAALDGKLAGFYTKSESDARYLQPSALMATTTQAPSLILDFTEGSVLTHAVTAPSAGTLLIWTNVTFEEDAGTPGDGPVHATVRLDGTAVGTVQESTSETDGFNASESIANSVATPVTAGPHTVSLNLESVEGVQVAIEGRSITTLFIPS